MQLSSKSDDVIRIPAGDKRKHGRIARARSHGGQQIAAKHEMLVPSQVRAFERRWMAAQVQEKLRRPPTRQSSQPGSTRLPPPWEYHPRTWSF